MDYLFKILSSIDLFLNVKIDAIFIPLLLINFKGGGDNDNKHEFTYYTSQ